MNVRMINRVETGAEQAAAALLALSVGYAVYSGFREEAQHLLYAAAAATAAYLLCLYGMKAASSSESRFTIRVFDVRNIGGLELDELLLTDEISDTLLLTDSDRVDAELVLTDADRLQDTIAATSEPLVLDDVLAAVGEGARVVRLFDRKAMPTPGQLSSSIERHLDRAAHASQPDAAQALSNALAELRRSLR